MTTEQEIHDLVYTTFSALETLENKPTYEHNKNAISAVEKLRELKRICLSALGEIDNIETKIIEEDAD